MSKQNVKAWWKKFKSDRKTSMVPFDFERLMKDRNLTVREFATWLGYTEEGTVQMLKRGTIKPTKVQWLEIHYDIEVSKYVKHA